MIDSLTDSVLSSWIVGALLGVLVVFLIGGYVRKYDISFGKVRPQILVVLLALSLIALAGLFLNESNVTSVAVAGMIALATRVIERDSPSNSE